MTHDDYVRLAAKVVPDLARLFFKRLDPEEYYLIVRPGKATPWTQARLFRGVPFNIVGAAGEAQQLPLRDDMIYHLSEFGAGDHEVEFGWVDALVGDEVADQKQGKDITVGEIWACAQAETIARIAALMAAGDPQA